MATAWTGKIYINQITRIEIVTSKNFLIFVQDQPALISPAELE